MSKVNSSYLFFCLTLICGFQAEAKPVSVDSTDVPPQEASNVVELVAVGDVNPWLQQGELFRKDPYDVLGPAKEWIAKADIAFANFESVVVEPDWQPVLVNKLPILQTPPFLAYRLKEVGFDIVSLANNHPFDFGTKGVHLTIKTLDKAGLLHVGLGRNIKSARKPIILEKKGISFGFIAAARAVNQPLVGDKKDAAMNWLDVKRLVKQVKALKNKVDVVVVSLHWGRSYTEVPMRSQRRQAEQFAAAGADIILGHHPHVLQPIQMVGPKKQVPVAYSLGNFLFGLQKKAAARTIVLRARFLKTTNGVSISSVEALPLYVNSKRRLRRPRSKAHQSAFREFFKSSPSVKRVDAKEYVDDQ